jgi:hypothetical protein
MLLVVVSALCLVFLTKLDRADMVPQRSSE